jgi:hypothetical protein
VDDKGIRDFFRSPVRPAKLGTRPAAYSMDTSGSLCGIKRSGREADHSTPSIGKVKNVWSCTSLHDVPAWYGA